MKPMLLPGKKRLARTADQAAGELARRVEQAFRARHPALRPVRVSADRGAVRLTGTLKSYHMKQLAFSLTSKVPGVNQVIDELIVDRSTTEALSEALSPAEG